MRSCVPCAIINIRHSQANGVICHKKEERSKLWGNTWTWQDPCLEGKERAEQAVSLRPKWKGVRVSKAWRFFPFTFEHRMGYCVEESIRWLVFSWNGSGGAFIVIECVCLFLCACVHIHVCVTVCAHVCACFYLCICVHLLLCCLCVCVAVFVCARMLLCLCLSTCVYECICLSVLLCLCLSVCLFLCCCVCVSVCLSICVCASLFVCLSSVQIFLFC